MKHLRKGVNDYVMTRTVGSRELLYVSDDVHGQYKVYERHKGDVVPVDGEPFDTRSDIGVQLPLSVFTQSMLRLKGQAVVEHNFCTKRLAITLLRFSAYESVKWATYLVDGATCFAPRCVGILLPTDIQILSDKERRAIRATNAKLFKKGDK